MLRIEEIKRDVQRSNPHLCPERAYLVTEFFKEHDDPTEPTVVRQARALEYVLSNKRPMIFPGELIVGNAGTSRISCILQPELASPYMSTELLWIDRRHTNPFKASLSDRLRLTGRVYPYWIRRGMPMRMFPDKAKAAEYMRHQLKPTFYLVNEAGGIGHFLPNYEKVIRLGVSGYLESFDDRDEDLHLAARIAARGLVRFAGRLAEQAERMALTCSDEERREDLVEIARICGKVPAGPAESFNEALQSLWLTHLAVNLESLNSAVSFGRMDQYLYPYYQRDIEQDNITRERAMDLLLSFSIKACEHLFLLSERISEYHGGYLVVQAAIVGGTDREGNDATNPLTHLMLDVMEHHRLRDPNYQVRVHPGTPDDLLKRALDVARQGFGVPALFNDESVVPALAEHGIPLEDARDYGIVGCVEPSIPGKSFLSTDAGLFNLPICLEMALNRGKRFRGRTRQGEYTGDPAAFESIEEVIDAFRAQVDLQVDRMIDDFHMVERGNAEYHPTPLSSMLVDGCLESGRDLTVGGAVYNSSGLQGVGVADVADSLAALEKVVFSEKRMTMGDVVETLKSDFEGFETVRAELLKAPKFGNDESLPDGFADRVVRIWHDSLARHTSTRGGRYVPGFYSVTSHVAFGSLTGALPSGRRSGEPFASSMGPACGADRCGPTALLNSVSSLDEKLMPNGNALNIRFDPADIEGDEGLNILKGLVKGFFERGGMEVQLNVLDPKTLEDARANPGKYPELVVRVAGYCAYFDDLPDSAKDEIIKRTRLKVG